MELLQIIFALIHYTSVHSLFNDMFIREVPLAYFSQEATQVMIHHLCLVKYQFLCEMTIISIMLYEGFQNRIIHTFQDGFRFL